MADAGINWSAWAYVDYDSGTDWNAVEQANANTIVSDKIDLDGKVACEVSFEIVEDDTGDVAAAGVETFVLGSIDGTQFEEAWKAWLLNITAVRNDTVLKKIAISPKHYGSCKISVYNNTNQTLETTLQYRTGTIPKATA